MQKYNFHCPAQRCKCHPESHMVNFRGRVEVGDGAPIFRRPAYLDFPTCRYAKSCGDFLNSGESLNPFPIVNDCRGQCSVEVDTRRFFDRLYRGGECVRPNQSKCRCCRCDK